jgi:phosphoribosylglycinamide formyltransferase-1
MPVSFISEPIIPLDASFDTRGMARGEPGVPHKFRWRKKEFHIVRVLEQWKDHGDCTHGSGERYVRKHGYRVEMSDGSIFRLFFKRSFGRGKFTTKDRWWIQSIERDCSAAPVLAD